MLFASQKNKQFKCDIFTFAYPSNYSQIPIQNASHMRLKIQNQKYVFAISYWDKGYKIDTNVWDDKFYESCKNLPLNGKIIGIEKVMVPTQQGRRRTIKIMSIIKETHLTVKSVTYIMIHNSYLFVFTFISEGNTFKPSEIVYEDNFFKGLSFSVSNNINNNTNANSHNYLLNTIKDLNAQCPFKADDITTYKNIILSGNLICVKLAIPKQILGDIDFSAFKTKMCINFRKAVPKEFLVQLQNDGYAFSYLIYDEEDILYKIINITPQDILSNL